MSGGWYIYNRVRAAGPVQVTVYDEIGHDGVRAKHLLNAIGDAESVELRINSGGGDVFEAMTMFERLSKLPDVSVVVDGLAASAASVVAMAASRGQLAMAAHSRMMIHDSWTVMQGNAAELQAQAAVLDSLSSSIASIYAARSGKRGEYMRALMQRETWFTAAQAVEKGLADCVLPSPFEALVAGQVRAALRNVVTGRG